MEKIRIPRQPVPVTLYSQLFSELQREQRIYGRRRRDQALLQTYQQEALPRMIG
jgi:hypothetical protein